VGSQSVQGGDRLCPAPPMPPRHTTMGKDAAGVLLCGLRRIGRSSKSQGAHQRFDGRSGMSLLFDSMSKVAIQMGIQTCLELDPRFLIVEQRIRDLCAENRCGNYGNNYMCPPHIGSLEETAARLKEYQRGVLLQYSRSLRVEKDREEAMQAKIAFHHRILDLESYLNSQGIQHVWGMMGGDCELCAFCKAKTAEPCPYPDEARTSLEAIGVDVLALRERFGLDTRFHPDSITWTGCILF
jgi:predicted metal-binding protein